MTATTLSSWLLTYWLHSSLLLGLAWLSARWVASPALREALWKTALLGGVATATVHSLGVGPRATTFAVRTAVTAPRAAAPVRLAEATPPAPSTSRLNPTGDERSATDPAVPPAASPRSLDGRDDTGWSAPVALVAAWSSIAGLLVLVFGFRRWQLARRLGGRLVLRSHPAVDELASLRRAAGLRRPVVLTVCDRLASPIVVGLSEVSVPGIALEELEAHERRSMLAHELAHLVRFDPAWLSVAALIERIFFFQPLNRLARGRIQAEAELLCDAWAAKQAGSGVTLAKCLVKVAEWIDAAPRPIPIAGMAEERSQLVDRVRRLVEEEPMMWKPRRRVVVLGVGASLVITAALAPKVLVVGQDPGGGVSTAGVIAAGGSIRQDTSSAVVAALLEALKDTHAEVRRAAAHSLGQLGDRRATAGLISASRDDDAEVRAAATESLGDLEDPRGMDALAARLTDSVTEVRRAAIHALSHLDGRIRPDLLRPSLQDSDPEIRAAAARALGELEDRGSVAELVRLLADRNAEVRQSALNALAELDLETVPAEVLEMLRDGNAEVRQAAAHLVGEAGEVRAVPGLKQLLSDANSDVRQSAVNALSGIRDGAAIDALVAALKSTDPVVRKAAAEALGQRHEQ
jgi:HEAT repeat protein